MTFGRYWTLMWLRSPGSLTESTENDAPGPQVIPSVLAILSRWGRRRRVIAHRSNGATLTGGM
jgi:hypothetical protein